MGQFSWKCADTNRALIECYTDEMDLVENTWTKKAYLLIPKEFGGGHYFVNGNYEGYGVFYDAQGNEHDAYEELAKWNGIEGKTPDESRANAIDLYFTPVDPQVSRYMDGNHNSSEVMKFPLKITENPMRYEDAGVATDDPNQGWGEHISEDTEY